MIKKCVIFLFLTTAYTVLLAHNFTPHIHHSEQETHHHEDGNKHHHNDNKEEHDEEDTGSPFHLLQHTGSAIVFIPGQIIQTEIQKKVFETATIKLADLVIKIVDKPPLLLPSSRTQYLPQRQTLPYFFLLKAPPAFIA